MRKVQTTLGELKSRELGRVDVHEHIIIEGVTIERLHPEFIHGDVELIATEAESWKKAGGGVLIDCSPIGAGRKPDKLEVVSKISGVPIIISTGFHKSSYYSPDHWVYKKNVDEIHKILFMECSQGVLINDNQPINGERLATRAGAIKAGIDPKGLTLFLIKLLKAARPIMGNFNIPLMIHTENGVPILKLADWLERNKFLLDKIVFCHMDKNPDFHLHRELAERGFFIEYDSMVREVLTFQSMSKLIFRLFEKNLGNKLLFAGDLARKSYWKCYGGKPGLAYLVSGLNMRLKEFGISNMVLAQIWIRNPKSLYSK